MEKKLQEFLRPGEQVCWQGQPGPFGLMEGSCKKQILCKWGVAVVIIGLLLWSYITFNTNPSVGFVAMVLLVGVIILASPWRSSGACGGSATGSRTSGPS